MSFKKFKNPVATFLVKAFVLYLLWIFFYQLWLHPKHILDTWIIKNITSVSYFILSHIGYDTSVYENFSIDPERSVGINGGEGLWIGDSCNGLSLFALFAGFIIAYPGSSKKKIWYIPLGLISIHFINILRVIALAIINFYNPSNLAFHHTYTFTMLVYAYVFILWMIWVNKIAVKNNEAISK